MPVTPPSFVAVQGASESFNNDQTQHTINVVGPTQGILVIECGYNGGTPQTPTVAGSSAGVTLLASQTSPAPSTVGLNVYYLLNPTAGAKLISFQSPGATIVSVLTRFYNSVNQTTPFGTPVKSSGNNSATISSDVPTAVGELVIDMAQWRGSGATRTGAAGAGQTTRVTDPGPSDGRGASEETAAGTTTTMSWTLSHATTPATPEWVHIAAVLNGFNDVQSSDLNASGVGALAAVGNYRVPGALTAPGSCAVNFNGEAFVPPPQRFYMSKGNAFETELLALIFNATSIPNLAINATASPLTSLFVALHTADPGEAGDQTTNETAYTGYARQSVARTSGGFNVASGTVAPVANIDFPVCTAAPGTTLTHASIGVAISGASKILYSGPINPQIAIAVGVIPRLTTASLVTED